MVGHGGSGRVKCWGHAHVAVHTSTILDVHHYFYKGKRGGRGGEENIEVQEGGGGGGGGGGMQGEGREVTVVREMEGGRIEMM